MRRLEIEKKDHLTICHFITVDLSHFAKLQKAMRCVMKLMRSNLWTILQTNFILSDKRHPLKDDKKLWLLEKRKTGRTHPSPVRRRLTYDYSSNTNSFVYPCHPSICGWKLYVSLESISAIAKDRKGLGWERMEESLLQLFRKSNVCVITVYGMKVCFWRIWRENNFINGFQIFYVIPLCLCGF